MTIDQTLNHIYPLPGASASLLKKCITEVHYPKGCILLKANRIEQNIYFIRKGIVRAYALSDGNEITFWFGKEGDAVISMKSYVARQEGYEDIELLEDCELYKMNAQSLQQLYDHDIHIANWGRRLAEQELIRTEERLISRQLGTAADRYKTLLSEHPHLVRRVQLGYIASYLGITQVSLSRIRADIR